MIQNLINVVDNITGTIDDALADAANTGTSQPKKATVNPKKTNTGPKFKGASLPYNNELEDYTSYNYIFTFSCLTNDELHFPEKTYRIKDPEITILRSGGGINGVVTEPEKNGSIEYFIDNVEIESIISPNRKSKQTNASRIKFQITEPYSMGIFLQELKTASIAAGHTNYLTAPFLLTVEFVGWDDDGQFIKKKKLRRLWPISLVDINFNVTEGGSVYEIEAIPWSEIASTDQVQSLKTDIKIIGSTVKEMCQTGLYSLASILNSREQQKRIDGEVTTADEFVIIFPKDAKEKLFAGTLSNTGTGEVAPSIRTSLATSKPRLWRQSINEKTNINSDFSSDLDNVDKTILGVMVKRSNLGEFIRYKAEETRANNQIGRSKIIDDNRDGVKKPFSKPKFVELTTSTYGQFERNQIQVSDNLATLTFKAGTTIQDIIEEIILSSEYGRKIGSKTPDAYGMISWFKIELEVYNLKDKEQEIKAGRPPRIYVFKVVPYKTHISRYSPVSQPSLTNSLRSQCVKEYNYIYTGKNDNIIDFDISFNRAFFLASTPFGGKNKAGTLDANASRRAGTEQVPRSVPSSGGESNSKSGSAVYEESYKPGTGFAGGGMLDKVTNSVARDFNDAILNSTVDLVNVNMTIWGDPYYIVDSGFGNYTAVPEDDFLNLNSDGSMNYQDGEVHILLNFRTPFDYPHSKKNANVSNDGFMDFYADGTHSPKAFSGIYQVVQVTNNFSEGKFSQQLKMIRIRNQEKIDTNELADPKKGVARTVVSNEDINRAAGNAGGGV